MMTADVVSIKQEVSNIVRRLAEDAHAASALLAEAKNDQKDMALVQSALAIREHASAIMHANEKDITEAKAAGLNEAQLDRLKLDGGRIEALAVSLETVATMPDPVNKMLAEWTRPNGLIIQRVSVPLGVIGIIYESRPNVTADSAGLCIKSGNSCLLRGGSESFHSSAAIVECIHRGLKAAGLPEHAVQVMPTKDRALVGAMLSAVGLIDVVIPRGGKSLTQRVRDESKVPTLLHLDGNCHTYIHREADAAMALSVLVNAKMRRVGVCGATESLLIDEAIAPELLPKIAFELTKAHCEMRGCDKARAIDPRIKAANDDDWATEYLAPMISIKVVADIDEATRHINHYGSHHTDAIITENKQAARQFLRQVDSAIVLHNASTQFADGGEFGFGAEIGIATGRLHARGPVGAEQLTTYKYVIHGNGQVRG
ncbi:MAG: glutamate-5-semialdehyde dehydrogenase [Alphaproteobacteria bacterium]|nr:glutamate-5-semialdehyde dehydrogenase [Alphaproteobacteria bacterium]